MITLDQFWNACDRIARDRGVEPACALEPAGIYLVRPLERFEDLGGGLLVQGEAVVETSHQEVGKHDGVRRRATAKGSLRSIRGTVR